MSSKETRFSYVYKSLKCRITERLLLPGSRLPSSRVLKDEYQAVSYTHLKESGHIKLRVDFACSSFSTSAEDSTSR